MVFICSICKAEYPILPVEPKPDYPPEHIEKLKEAFYSATDRLMTCKPEQIDSFVRKAEITAMAYFSVIRYTGVERIPDTLVSEKCESGYRLRCYPACEDK